MINFEGNMEIYAGMFLIFYSLAMFLFPPRFGDFLYGICTKETMKNEVVWSKGQKLFAISTLATGIIFFALGCFKIPEEIPPFLFVLLLIVLWNLSKFLINKNLGTSKG